MTDPRTLGGHVDRTDGRAIRVLVVDDHEGMRSLLNAAFRTDPAYELVGETASIADALEFARLEPLDIVILDHSVDQALAGVAALKRAGVGSVVVYSASPADSLGATAFAAGADAYLEKGSPRALLSALRAVTHGATEPSPEDASAAGIAAVIAHGMLNTVAVVAGSASLLEVSWGAVADQRDELTRLLCDQAQALRDQLDLLPAVTSHALLNELACVLATCDAWRDEGMPLETSARSAALARVVAGANRAQTILVNVVRGLPQALVEALDELGALSSPGPNPDGS